LLKKVSDVLGAVGLSGQSALDGLVKSNGSVRLKKIVQLVDVGGPGAGTAMNDLGQIVDGRGSDVEDVLSLEVAPPSFAGDGGQSGSAVLRKNRLLIAFGTSLMNGLEAAGDNAEAVAVEKKRAWKTGRVGRHRVGARIVKNLGRRPDADGKPKGQLLGSNAKRSQASPILINPCRRRDIGGTTGSIVVALMKPLAELIEQIRLVVEASLFEK
jgi:hypothetical protein